MKAYSLREAAVALPGNQQADLVSAWLSPGVDYIMLCRDSRRKGTSIVRVGPEGEIHTLAKALRSVRFGRPYGYIEALAFTEAQLRQREQEVREREAKTSQTRPPFANSLLDPEESEGHTVDEITTARLLEEWELSLQQLQKSLEESKRELKERDDYISYIEQTLSEQLEEMNRRTDELEQQREDLEQREVALARQTGVPNLRVVAD